MNRRRTAVSALVAVLLCTSAAAAHPTNNGNVIANIEPERRSVDFMISVIAVDLGDFLKLDRDGNNIVDEEEMERGSLAIADHIRAKTAVRNNGRACPEGDWRFVDNPAQPKMVHLMRTFTCGEALGEVEIENTVLFEDVGGYRHYARIQLGDRIHTTTFARGFPTTVITVPSLVEPAAAEPPNSDAGEVFVRYLWEGVLHILIGIDHVLFVICLLVLAANIKRLLAVITAFTAGHTVTLVLSALDVVTVAPRIIESVIALSIVYVAVENIVTYQRGAEEPRYRFVITALFGLVHGFGFSYVLRDEVGLPTETLVPALLAFNVGVEIGQLGIVACAYPLLRWWMKRDSYRFAVWALCVPVAAVACYWLVVRALALS